MILRNATILFCSLACVLPSVALAQPRAEGFALDRFEPSERGSDWFVLESLDLRGHQRFAAGLVLDYAHNPLVLYEPNGDERAPIVGSQLFGHVGGNIILWDLARFGLNLPIQFYQDGEGGSSSTTTFVSDGKFTVGDLRLSSDVRLYGKYGDPYTFGAGMQLFLPTGSQESFTGDGSVRLIPRGMMAGTIGKLVYASSLGVNVRFNDNSFAGSPRGTELSFAAAIGGTGLDGKASVGPELYFNTVVSDGDGFFGKTSTPVELLLGGHYRPVDGFRFGLGIGPGLTRALGTPQFRALLSLEWVEPYVEEQPPLPPPPPPAAPPPEPEKPAPPPPDRDKDTILDADDACPDEPGIKTDDPKTNGCPDRDKDGILDKEDACPDEPGVKTDDPKTNGCPPPKDRDGDTILDPQDACPDVAGPANEDPKKHGCPVARIEKGQIIIREQVQFAYNSAQILVASNFILEAVHKVLTENPDLVKISIQGHTDSKGGDAFNKRLSANRANAVMQWLIRKGIDKKRFDSQGFGEEKPIDSNDTDEGRANNRRVEFHIVERAEATAAVPATPPAAP